MNLQNVNFAERYAGRDIWVPRGLDGGEPPTLFKATIVGHNQYYIIAAVYDPLSAMRGIPIDVKNPSVVLLADGALLDQRGRFTLLTLGEFLLADAVE